jgi:hypothetical protein
MTPILPRLIAIRELGELSEEEWSATTVATSMPATRQMPPMAAKPTARRVAHDRPRRWLGLLTFLP